MGVECREERVIEHGEDLGFRLDMRKLLCRKGVPIDDLKSEVGVVVVTEAAEEDAAEVSGADVAQKLEVAKMQVPVGGEGGGGLDGRPMGIGAAVGAEAQVGSGGGGGGRE